MAKSDVVRQRLERAPRKRRRGASPHAIADLIGSVEDLPSDLAGRKKSICVKRAMARNVLVDAGFLVALLSGRDNYHAWTVSQASEFPPPWGTCEAVLSEAFHLLGERGTPQLAAMLQRRALTVAFELGRNPDPVIKLMKKYSAAPMSLADACLVRMSETLADSVILTTDADFRAYRRHGRPVVPCVIPKKEVALQYSTGLNWDEVENRTL